MKLIVKKNKLESINKNGLEASNNKITISKAISEPICISHFLSSDKKNTTDIYIEVKNNVGVTLIDDFEGDLAGARNHIINYHFNLLKDSRVDFLVTQKSDMNRNINSEIGENASFEIVNTFLKENNENVNIHCHLNKPHAEAFLKGIYFSDKKQENNINAIVEHHNEHTYSDLIYKGILDDESSVNYRGCVILDKKAQKSSSSQLNKNILLSDKVNIKSKPELKVFADDVKATHGTTVGELSEEELFYFQSRGINIDEARKLMLKGFLNNVVFGVRNKSIHDLVLHQISEVI